ncbi:MAG TPA: glycerol-3-phosphate acyltransferase [Anaerolineales bacterium]|nr:glycerol-3-phosphate acyltransferase [Anaerolineales bacterium]
MKQTMDILLWTALGFLSGSIPFAVILGKLAGKGDIRQVSDGNPGATNVLRAAGWKWGVPAFLLDYFKGVLPVGLAWFIAGLNGWGLVLAALAPVAGHIWSPWLGWRGGKAVAATFGIWSGLTVGAGPTILGLLLGVAFATLSASGWAVILAFMAFGAFVWRNYAGVHPEFTWVWLGNYALLVWAHRKELKSPPGLRPGLLALSRKLLYRADVPANNQDEQSHAGG